MITFDIISIFPQMFSSYFAESILKRAQEKKLLRVRTHDLRKWSLDKHHKVDDKPYGGGPGMVMAVEPFFRALKTLKRKKSDRVILLSAKGAAFTQADAKRLATYKRIVLLCGRYEGVDERVAEHLADEEISIGNYVLTGGELPAMVIADAVSRHIPGVLGAEESLADESHDHEGVTEYPHYTRPELFSPKRGVQWDVPNELLSGDHKKIAEWRTAKKRRI